MSFTLWSPAEASNEDLLVMELPGDLLARLEREHVKAKAVPGGTETNTLDLLRGETDVQPLAERESQSLASQREAVQSSQEPDRGKNRSDETEAFTAGLMSQGPDSPAYFVTPTETYELRFLDSTNTHAVIDAPPQWLAYSSFQNGTREMNVFRFYSSIVEFRKCCPPIGDLLEAIPLTLPRSPIRDPFFLSSFPREKIIGSHREISAWLSGLWCCKYPSDSGGSLEATEGNKEQPMAIFDLSSCCPGLAYLCAARVDRATGECVVPIAEAVDTLTSTTEGLTEFLSYSILPFLCRTVEGRLSGPDMFSRWLETDAFPKYDLFGHVQLSPIKILSGLLLDLIARISRQFREDESSGHLARELNEFSIKQPLERLPSNMGAIQTASGAVRHSEPFTLGALARNLATEKYPAEFYISVASEVYTHLGELDLGVNPSALVEGGSEDLTVSELYDPEGERPTALLLAVALLPRPLSSPYWTPAANCWISLQSPVTGDTRALWYDRKALPIPVLERVFFLSDAKPAEVWHGTSLTAMCIECCESAHAAEIAVLAATRRSGSACDGHDLLRVKPEKRYALGAGALLGRKQG